MKLKKALAAVLLLVSLTAGLCGCESAAQDYYTQIDNAFVKTLDNSGDNMKYEYRLTAYDAQGTAKTVAFKTSRELKQDAYLCLWIVPVRGVVRWEQVAEDQMPGPVRAVYRRN